MTIQQTPDVARCALCPWVSPALAGDDAAAQALFAHSDTAHGMTCAGGELAPDLEPDSEPGWWQEYCDYCEADGHSFRSCPARDDQPDIGE